MSMSQQKLATVKFKVDGLFSPGHARRCEAMIRNSAGGIESVKADDFAGTVTIVYDMNVLKPHFLRDIVDDTGYAVIDE